MLSLLLARFRDLLPPALFPLPFLLLLYDRQEAALSDHPI